MSKDGASFSRGNDIVKAYKSGKSIVSLLGLQDQLCPLIGKDIKFVKRLGKGTYGEVFSISWKGSNIRANNYVLKKQANKFHKENTLKLSKSVRELTMQEYSQYVDKSLDLNPDVFIQYNGGKSRLNLQSKIGDRKHIIMPDFAMNCVERSSSVLRIRKAGTRDKYISIPKGSYLCENEIYSEYVINLIVANLYKEGKSINFLDKFDFISCPSDKKSFQYIFMEMVDGSLESFKNVINDLECMSIFIQLVHSIGAYQHYYKINHYDLFPRNILIKRIDSSTKYKGQKLCEAVWYKYSFKGNDLYIPATKYIIKIGDFGFAVRWSKPIIGNIGILKNNFNGVVFPNYFTEFFDLSVLIENIFDSGLFSDKFRNNLYNSINIPEKGINVNSTKWWDKYKHITPYNIFRNKKLFSNYMTRPSQGKIITLGNIK